MRIIGNSVGDRSALVSVIAGLVAGCHNGVIAQSYQPLLRNDASWDVGLYESASICGWVDAKTYFIMADTLIDGVEYARFGYHPTLDIDGPPFCPPGYYVASAVTTTDVCLREDTIAGLVFQYDHMLQAERVLYDYNLEVGDTIHDYFDFDQIGFPPTPTLVVFLDSVQLTDGVYHRRWGLSTDLWDEILHHHIEGVGSSFGITHELPQYYGDGFHLWCYKRNEVDVLWSVHYCPLPGPLSVETPPLTPQDQTSLYGLAVDPQGRITVHGNGETDVTIFDLNGRTVFVARSVPEGSVLRTTMVAGTYLYTIDHDQQRAASRSLVIQN